MSACNESSFAAEIHHLDVKYHVAGDPLVANGSGLTKGKDAKCDSHVLHFLGNGLCPKGIAIDAV